LADFFKSSPPKLIGQMNRNMVGSIYGRSSIQIAHFVPIRSQTWPPQAILVSNWSGRNEQSLYRTFHRCFLTSFGSFGYAVLEKSIFLNLLIRNNNWIHIRAIRQTKVK
jgi:hypothetical protein